MKPYHLLLTGILPLATAFGPRGAAERILYYSAYLAEGSIIHPPQTFTIAPGCSGSLPGGRCTFSQFCQHIWEASPPAVGDTVQPRVAIPNTDDFINESPQTLFEETNTWRDPSTRFGVTGNIDNNKLCPGSRGYVDAFTRCGNMIQNAINTAGSSPTDDQKKIFAQGKASSTMCTEQRWKDIEKHRIGKGELQRFLGVRPITKRKVMSFGQGFFNTFDAAATLKQYGGKNGFSRKTMEDGVRRWGKSGKAPGHLAAIKAANRVAGCAGGCMIPVSARLKRDVAAGLETLSEIVDYFDAASYL